MSISAIGHSGFSAMAAGVRGEMDARIMSEVLDSAGLLDSELAAALQSVADTSHSLISAGAAVTQSEMLGTLFDALA